MGLKTANLEPLAASAPNSVGTERRQEQCKACACACHACINVCACHARINVCACLLRCMTSAHTYGCTCTWIWDTLVQRCVCTLCKASMFVPEGRVCPLLSRPVSFYLGQCHQRKQALTCAAPGCREARIRSTPGHAELLYLSSAGLELLQFQWAPRSPVSWWGQRRREERGGGRSPKGRLQFLTPWVCRRFSAFLGRVPKEKGP